MKTALRRGESTAFALVIAVKMLVSISGRSSKSRFSFAASNSGH
jgi:hypothetical protein